LRYSLWYSCYYSAALLITNIGDAGDISRNVLA
jgi:hypothetical protein